MLHKYSYLLLSLLLSGCAGTALLDEDNCYIDSPFPDIRTVPPRSEATAPRRGCQKKAECDLQRLESDRKKIKSRDEALREEFFPN